MMLQEHALDRATAGTGAAVDYSGSWANELGSVMTLNQVGEKLTGIYESTVSSSGQKTTGDLQGYVDGDLIAFIVHWRDFQAITSWVGQLEPGGQTKLKTLWQLVKQVKAGDEWSSVNAGSDEFTRK